MKRFFYVAVLICFYSSLSAQTLPDLGQLVLWLRADSGVVMGMGGDSITQWQDVSGNSNSTTGPAAADSLPIFIAHDSMLNNLPAVSFNKSLAANRQEFYGTSIPKLDTSSLTLFIVHAGYAMSASAYTGGLFSVGPLLSGITLHRFQYGGTYACRFLNDYNSGNGVLLTNNNTMPTAGYNYAVWSVQKTIGSIASIYVNDNMEQNSTNTGLCGTINPPAGTPYLIANSNNGGAGGFDNLNGKIAEIIVYAGALDTTDQQTVRNYLYNKYAPPVNLGPDTVTASLCPVILNAGNRFVKYRWSTGDSIHSQISVTQSGIYSITVTDVFGRVSADTINVTVPFKGPSSSDTTICYGTTAVLTQVITNPGNYTYTWSTSATTQSITVSTPGKYYGTVSDGTCQVLDTIIVKEDSFSLRILLPTSAHICGGTSPKLNDAGYTPVSYLWSPGGSTADSIQISNPGTYSVTVTDINQCTASGSCVITIGGHAPVANFSIANVCYTYPTNFTNLSTAVNGDGIASYSWTFPNALPGTSAAQNPSVTYNGLGTAYATLAVTSDSGCVDTKADTFTIHQNPIAQFTGAPGCTPNSYQFINQSSAPTGDGVSGWLWNFGDGTTDTSQNPLHQYANNGTFTVSLTITDSAGCSNTLTQHVSLSQIIPLTQPVPVLPGDNAAFQDTVVFFAWNTVPGATSYTLEIDSDPLFGNPTYINNITATSYTLDSLVQGTTYYWEIIANNLCGGHLSSKEDTFSIFNPTTFGCLTLWLRADSVVLSGTGVKTWKDASGLGNSTTGPVQQDSMPTWIAQDPALNNQPAISFNPTTTTDYQEFYGTNIPNIGTSSLTTFVVAAGYNCSALSTLYREGFITFGSILQGMWLNRNLIDQSYSFLNNYGSEATDLIAGNNTLPNTGFNYKLLEMQKDFSNSVTLDTNGTTAAAITDPIVSGSFTPGPYLIGNTSYANLTGFWNLHGKIAEILVYTCALTPAQQQQVQNYIYTRYAPPVYLGADTALHNLCPYTINAGSRFIGYQWSTGDSVHSQISVTQAGAYTVTATDIFGHTSSSTINITFPYEGPSPADTTICLGQSAVLKELLNNPTSYTYSWSTGGTADSITVSAPGNYTCNIFDGTCHLIDTIYVKVDSFPLVTLLQADTLICGGSSPAINLHGYTPLSYLWSPGGSTSATPAFDSAGVYYLTVTDIHGCLASDSIALTFHAHAPIANFSISNFCYGNQTFFTNLDTMYQQDSINSIVWSLPGANPDSAFIPSPVVTYLSVGAEVVTLHITTDSGCTASKTDSLFINKDPQASFTYTGNNSTLNLAYILCAGDNNYAILTDQSLAGFSTDSLISRVWSINGVIDSGTLADSVILYPIPNPGIYNVMLVVENEKNCVDTLVQQVQVYAPLNADFSYSNICLSDTTRFLDQTHSYSIVTWQWDFGDGSNDNYTENPAHQYPAPGIYPVSLEVTNAIGCESFTSKNVTVVDTPSANFSGSFACQNELYEPLDSSIAGSGDAVISWNWLIADSALDTRYPQILIPAGVSSFQTQLVITTMDGCSDSISKTLPIYPSPSAAFNFTPLYGTAPITVNFTNTSTGAVSYDWDFGDGSPYNTDLDPSHYYASDSTYTITLDAINSYGCIDSVSHQIQLEPTVLDIAVDTVYVVTLPQSNGTDLVEVIAEVSNVGTRLITSAQFKVTLGCGGGTYIQSWTGNLMQGAGMYDTIPVFFDVIPAAANCYVCVTAQDVNNGQTEINYANNEVCVSLTGTMQLAGPSPNPAMSQSTLGIIMPQPGQVSVDIIDELGQYVVSNYTLHLPAGLTNYQIPVSRLNGAEYYIRVTYNGDVEVRKLITR